MNNSKIEWTDHTFNPWIGCMKVSEGCKNCYAETDMDKRRNRAKWGPCGTRSVTSYMYWRKVLSWNREASKLGKPQKVFCASLADVFEDWDGHVVDSKGEPLCWNDRLCDSDIVFEGKIDRNGGGYQFTDCDDIPPFSHYPISRLTKETSSQEFMEYDKWLPLSLQTIRQHLSHLIERTPNLYWLLLTKRPENIINMVPDHWKRKFPPNVWIGTSVENQEAANERIPHLLKVPASVRFLSCEPLLGPVDLMYPESIWPNGPEMCCSGNMCGCMGQPTEPPLIHGISWVIVGGESGHGARPVHPTWIREIRNQCKNTRTAFFFKQFGDWLPVIENIHSYDNVPNPEQMAVKSRWLNYAGSHGFHGEMVCMVSKCGKKKSGRLLDGVEHNEFPNI